MINQEEIIHKIKNLAQANKDVGVVWLYGSRAKGTPIDSSDFDIAIAFNDFSLDYMDKYLRPNEMALDWQKELGLAEKELSIVDISQAPTYLALNIVETGEVLYGDDSSRMYREIDKIRRKYEHEQVRSR